MATDKILHLDARLRSAVRLVRPGHIAADIGCDHGKLSAVLIKSGRCPFVIAADLREGPLQVAARNLKEAGCSDRVELRLGYGLDVLSPGEASDIVIAGMGAETICEILQKADWVSDPGVRLVLVPATKHSLLRLWLAQNGFSVRQETVSCVAGRYYTAIAAEYTGNIWEPDGEFCLMGALYGQPGWQGYLNQQLIKAQKYLRGLPKGEPEQISVQELIIKMNDLLRENKEMNYADGSCL